MRAACSLPSLGGAGAFIQQAMSSDDALTPSDAEDGVSFTKQINK